MSAAYRFSPSSWETGARDLDGVAKEFGSQAHAILGRLGSQTDLGGGTGTQTDQAVATIVSSLVSAAGRTVDGLARGLAAEATIMDITGRAYASVEDANETIAGQAGA